MIFPALPRLPSDDLFRYLVWRDEEAKKIIKAPSSSMAFDPGCVCKIETKNHLKEAIGQAILDAFSSDPSLSVERAVGLAYKQLTKVRPCCYWRDCVLGTLGEGYAKRLMGKLNEMSDELALSIG